MLTDIDTETIRKILQIIPAVDKEQIIHEISVMPSDDPRLLDILLVIQGAQVTIPESPLPEEDITKTNWKNWISRFLKNSFNILFKYLVPILSSVLSTIAFAVMTKFLNQLV